MMKKGEQTGREGESESQSGEKQTHSSKYQFHLEVFHRIHFVNLFYRIFRLIRLRLLSLSPSVTFHLLLYTGNIHTECNVVRKSNSFRIFSFFSFLLSVEHRNSISLSVEHFNAQLLDVFGAVFLLCFLTFSGLL